MDTRSDRIRPRSFSSPSRAPPLDGNESAQAQLWVGRVNPNKKASRATSTAGYLVPAPQIRHRELHSAFELASRHQPQDGQCANQQGQRVVHRNCRWRSCHCSHTHCCDGLIAHCAVRCSQTHTVDKAIVALEPSVGRVGTHACHAGKCSVSRARNHRHTCRIDNSSSDHIVPSYLDANYRTRDC